MYILIFSFYLVVAVKFHQKVMGVEFVLCRKFSGINSLQVITQLMEYISPDQGHGGLTNIAINGGLSRNDKNDLSSLH